MTSIALPDGRSLREALRTDGLAVEGVDVWFQQVQDGGGSRLTAMLWEGSRCGVKLVSEELAAVLQAADPTLQRQNVVLKDRKSQPISGYSVLMERVGELTPVHSMKKRSRGSSFVVSESVAESVLAASFTGLRLDPVMTPFPADAPLSLDPLDL